MSHAGLSTNEGSTTNLASNNSISSQESDNDDRVALAQSLLQRCLQKDTLLCELYMQLIKQVINSTLKFFLCTLRQVISVCRT